MQTNYLALQNVIATSRLQYSRLQSSAKFTYNGQIVMRTRRHESDKGQRLFQRRNDLCVHLDHCDGDMVVVCDAVKIV